jgi:hypothetical protein
MCIDENYEQEARKWKRARDLWPASENLRFVYVCEFALADIARYDWRRFTRGTVTPQWCYSRIVDFSDETGAHMWWAGNKAGAAHASLALVAVARETTCGKHEISDQ